MPTYFGLPLNLDEIIRLLNISNLVENDFESFTRQPYNHEIIRVKCNVIKKYINQYNIKLDLFKTNNTQYVLGYEIKQIYNVMNNFVNYDELINILKQLEKNFDDDIITLNVDLFHVELEKINDNNVYVNYPRPCILECSHY